MTAETRHPESPITHFTDPTIEIAGGFIVYSTPHEPKPNAEYRTSFITSTDPETGEKIVLKRTINLRGEEVACESLATYKEAHEAHKALVEDTTQAGIDPVRLLGSYNRRLLGIAQLEGMESVEATYHDRITQALPYINQRERNYALKRHHQIQNRGDH